MNDQLLKNYDLFVERVDTLCFQIKESLGEQISCHPGCSSCCLNISIFPVEQLVIERFIKSLSNVDRNKIIQQALSSQNQVRCGLLLNDRCMIYPVRPIICRTHGMPVVFKQDGVSKIDSCPKNSLFGVEIDSANAINLDTLNSVLVAINLLYCKESKIENPTGRMFVSDFIKSILKTSY